MCAEAKSKMSINLRRSSQIVPSIAILLIITLAVEHCDCDQGEGRILSLSLPACDHSFILGLSARLLSPLLLDAVFVVVIFLCVDSKEARRRTEEKEDDEKENEI